MNKLNTIHLHTRYSDGLNDAYEYIEEAIKQGLSSIGISDHSPVPLKSSWAMKKEDLPRYIEELNYLKKIYGKNINIYTGMELDYIQGLDVKGYIDFDELDLDYYIGSVHYIYSELIDGYGTADNTQDMVEKLLNEGFNGDSLAFYTRYYQTVREMIKEYNPILIAHFDVLEKRNIKKILFDPESEGYKVQVEMSLDLIKESCVEVNTGAMAKDIDVLYPSEYILKRCIEKNISVSINSDCHFISGLSFAYEKAIHLLKKTGFNYVHVFDGVMKKVKI
ncbi:MAG TPA: histidinol-phosphatase [Clostridia bacterium]|nr:MAG: Histidinol-phosphatase [Firmicutes bacterium ADurb.Bin146]HOD93268.1 histidinol-phosphatase [Clostridia bacterium]HQM39486.1 histidinol-phosphatase [Clostridia bacterium]